LNIGSGYIFFDETLQNRFRGFVSAHGISSNVRLGQREGEDIEAAIELEYDALMGEQREWDGLLCGKV
jgi:hypothetical protein